jgi:hypothetical protein
MFFFSYVGLHLAIKTIAIAIIRLDKIHNAGDLEQIKAINNSTTLVSKKHTNNSVLLSHKNSRNLIKFFILDLQ